MRGHIDVVGELDALTGGHGWRSGHEGALSPGMGPSGASASRGRGGWWWWSRPPPRRSPPAFPDGSNAPPGGLISFEKGYGLQCKRWQLRVFWVRRGLRC
jgi:hypothetical protein